MNQNNKNEKRIFTEEQIKEKLKARKNLLIVVSSLFFIIFVFFLLVTLANDLWEEDEFLPYAVIESFFIIISIITFIQYKKTDINSIKEEIEYDNHQKKLNFAYNDINANVVIILNERKKQYFYYNDVTNQWQYKL